MSFRIYNTSSTLVETTESPPVLNYKTLENYLNRVYSDGTAQPNNSDLVFIWSHLAGNLDNWAKNGLAGVKSTFRWGNQNLPQPRFTIGTVPLAESIVPLTQDLQVRDQIAEIVSTLPDQDQIWTPDYYTYPQTSINRFNPRWWNQFYFDWNVNNNNTSGTTPQVSSAIISSPLTLEGSNTGGPDGGTGQTFFYLATGSGMKFTTPPRSANAGGVCVALNKMHAYVIGIAFSLYPTKVTSGTALAPVERAAVLTAAVQGLTVPPGGTGAFPDSAFGGTSPVVSATTFLQSINDALYGPSGYFSLPLPATGVPPVSSTNAPDANSLVNNLLWNPLRYAYIKGSPGALSEPQTTVWSLVCFLCGLQRDEDAITSVNSGVICNPTNSTLNVSNCCDGSLTIPRSSAASQPYQYLAQVATNLTVADNFLDPFVNIVSSGVTNPQSGVGGGSFMNVSAVLNLSQWNSLGGWTTEIPCNPPSGSVGVSSPTITSSNGCTLLPSTDGGVSSTPTWWNADPSDSSAVSILGINDYAESCPDFEIPQQFLQ